MELRNTRNRQEYGEYRELQRKLIHLGYYEPNMGIKEMRDLVRALDLSLSGTSEAASAQQELERALRESEVVFSHPPHHSTMISGPSTSRAAAAAAAAQAVLTSSSSRSRHHRNHRVSANRSASTMRPERTRVQPRSQSSSAATTNIGSPPHNYTVHAEVHHTLSWSPSHRATPRAGAAAQPDDKKKVKKKENGEMDEDEKDIDTKEEEEEKEKEEEKKKKKKKEEKEEEEEEEEEDDKKKSKKKNNDGSSKHDKHTRRDKDDDPDGGGRGRGRGRGRAPLASISFEIHCLRPEPNINAKDSLTAPTILNTDSGFNLSEALTSSTAACTSSEFDSITDYDDDFTGSSLEHENGINVLLPSSSMREELSSIIISDEDDENDFERSLPSF